MEGERVFTLEDDLRVVKIAIELGAKFKPGSRLDKVMKEYEAGKLKM